jgi:hypothetical protein
MATSVTLKPNAIDISGSTSGTTTLQASAVAGTTTLTLPAATDTLVGKATTDTLTNKTLTTPTINQFSSAASTNLTIQSAGTTAMTIDTSQKVGIGTSPSYKLDVNNNTNAFVARFTGGTSSDVNIGLYANTASAFGSVGTISNHKFQIFTNGADVAIFDTSGNLGLGVTPSAYNTGDKVFQIGAQGSLDYSSGNFLFSNNFYNSSGVDKYITSTYATMYYQSTVGQHIWRLAPSGTAGNAITWTQAMTLDASGNLLVATTNSAENAGVGFKLLTSGQVACITTANTTNAQMTTYELYSTGAGTFRFYVGAGGTIYATSTTITAISDQRLKENIRDLDEGLATVMALKPRKFDWKDGKGADIKNARGFIAQEFEQVLPDMIEEWRDPAPEGEEPYKAINANLIPTLVKAIQEQQTIIEQLKADVAALKGA